MCVYWIDLVMWFVFCKFIGGLLQNVPEDSANAQWLQRMPMGTSLKLATWCSACGPNGLCSAIGTWTFFLFINGGGCCCWLGTMTMVRRRRKTPLSGQTYQTFVTSQPFNFLKTYNLHYIPPKKKNCKKATRTGTPRGIAFRTLGYPPQKQWAPGRSAAIPIHLPLVSW